jgi:hypothetical protein
MGEILKKKTSKNEQSSNVKNVWQKLHAFRFVVIDSKFNILHYAVVVIHTYIRGTFFASKRSFTPLDREEDELILERREDADVLDAPDETCDPIECREEVPDDTFDRPDAHETVETWERQEPRDETELDEVKDMSRARIRACWNRSST